MLKPTLLMKIVLSVAVFPVCAAAAAVTEDNFLVRTTGDLVALCSADKGDPLMTAAVSFCHGFEIGVYRALAKQEAARRGPKLFCVPNPPPTPGRSHSRIY
jgi:hypothetical protein